MLNKEFVTVLVQLFEENIIEEYWDPNNKHGWVANLQVFKEILEDVGFYSSRISDFVKRNYSLENDERIYNSMLHFKKHCSLVLDNPVIFSMKFEEYIKVDEFVKLREAARELFLAIMIVESRENDQLIFYKEDM